MPALRVLVVDDSISYRLVLKKAFEDLENCEFVGAAKDGVEALEKIAELKPDLVTLDIAMPNKCGLEVLRELNEQEEMPEVVLISSLTESGSTITSEALGLGALDYITKPTGRDLSESHETVKTCLAKVMDRIQHKRELQSQLSVDSNPRTELKEIGVKELATPSKKTGVVDVVVIAISTGGPEALAALFDGLPNDLGVPILIVQHMPPVFTKSLADSLNKSSGLEIKEAESFEPLRKNVAYIAPGGKQMKLTVNDGKVCIRITNDAPELYCKPSANYLFESVSSIYGGEVLALVMTGLGSDGTRGLSLLHGMGATVFSQSKESCAVWGMPAAAVEAGVVDQEYQLDQLAAQTSEFVLSRNKNESNAFRV